MKSPFETQLKRRHFLQGLSLVPLLLGAGLTRAAAAAVGSDDTFGQRSPDASANSGQDSTTPPTSPRRIPVLQNWTDETSALLTILGVAGWTFAPAVDSELQIQVQKTTPVGAHGRVLYQVSVTGLAVDRFVRFSIFDAQGHCLDTRSLKGLDLAAPSPKIAVMSCANYRHADHQAAIYAQVPVVETDVIFFIGDIIYCDSHLQTMFHEVVSPADAIERYNQTWDLLDFYQLEPLVPVLSVWDDHDYGQNNGFGTNPHVAEMHEMFRNFYPMPTAHARLNFGPGVSFRLNAFGLDFHFLDDRSFAKLHQTQWGDAQESWLADDYRASRNPAWIINGILFYHYFSIAESVEKKAHPSLLWLENLLKSHQKPTVLVAGDIHASQLQTIEASRFGYASFAVTSSAVHSSSANNHYRTSPAKGQIFYYGQENFLLIQPHLSANKMSLSTICATANQILPYPDVNVVVG